MSHFDASFAGLDRLYGRGTATQLSDAHVCVIGVGGVGSWAVEALARSGVGELTLVDLDEVCVTNINRQLPALHSTVGQAKVDVLRHRVLDINPQARVHVVHDFLTEASVSSLLSSRFTYVVDAIDQFKNKCILLEHCVKHEQPIVVVGGAGGRRDPTRIKIDDMTRARGDKMLAMVRKRLRQKFGFPRKGTWKVPAVFSDEPPMYPQADGTVCVEREPSEESLRMDCATGYGAASFVTATFGMMAASVVVNEIAS